MMIDQIIAGTAAVVSGLSLTLWWQEHRHAAKLRKYARDLHDSYHKSLKGYLAEIQDLRMDLAWHKAREDRLRSQRVAASAIAVQNRKARALARKAKDEAEAPARIERTLSALGNTTMRSRAQVVAPVKARRTKAKNSGAGAAAKTGG